MGFLNTLFDLIKQAGPKTEVISKMSTSAKGKMFLTGLEGICLSKYKCSAGVWTIGVGATKSEIPDLASWSISKTITIKEAFDLLDKSLAKYEAAIDKTLKRPVTQEQYDVLVSICYNIGTGGLSGSTFMKRINAGDTPANIRKAILMWDKPSEIIGRRTKEADLFQYGTYAGNGKANLFPVSALGAPRYNKGTNVDLSKYV
jgi:lysozyme